MAEWLDDWCHVEAALMLPSYYHPQVTSCLRLPQPVCFQFQNLLWGQLSTRLPWSRQPAPCWVRELLRISLVLLLGPLSRGPLGLKALLELDQGHCPWGLCNSPRMWVGIPTQAWSEVRGKAGTTVLGITLLPAGNKSHHISFKFISAFTHFLFISSTRLLSKELQMIRACEFSVPSMFSY